MKSNPAAVFGAIILTLVVWFAAVRVYRRHKHPLTNPVFLSVSAIIALLVLFHVDYAVYDQGGRWLALLLKPAVVALAIPLYRQRSHIVKNARPVAAGILAGCVVGVFSASGMILLLGGSAEMARTLAPKSVTTPVAIELSARIGGISQLTGCVVVATGIFGAMFGPEFLRRCGVRSRMAVGLAVGTASHGLGVARLESEDAGRDDLGQAMGIIGMTLNALATALLLPPLLRLMGI
jgi:predicted murein hydrolase (TIGR00659 family)